MWDGMLFHQKSFKTTGYYHGFFSQSKCIVVDVLLAGKCSNICNIPMCLRGDDHYWLQPQLLVFFFFSPLGRPYWPELDSFQILSAQQYHWPGLLLLVGFGFAGFPQIRFWFNLFRNLPLFCLCGGERRHHEPNLFVMTTNWEAN